MMMMMMDGCCTAGKMMPVVEVVLYSIADK